ncbi:MAG: ComEC/Rec2 family competence protein [Patescibacteria group bacterium]
MVLDFRIILTHFRYNPAMKMKTARWWLIAAILALAGVRYLLWWPKVDAGQLAFYNDQGQTAFTGVVIREPQPTGDAQKLVVAGDRLRGRVLITAAPYPVYQYGDRLEVDCRLKAPEPFDGFAYDRYLARLKIYSLCYQPQIKLISRGQGNWFYAQTLWVKGRFNNIIDRGMPSPESALLKAILFGQQSEMPTRLMQEFAQTGVTHIIAVSGSHVTIIGGILFNLFLALGFRRKVIFYLTTGSLLVFLLVIGWPASAVRAVIMGFLGLWAMQAGRLNNSSFSLILAAAVMLAINPWLLLYDVGFQLSFLAVWGMMVFTERIENLFDKLPFAITNTLGFRDSLIMTLAAEVATLPLIIYQFGLFSVVAPLANVLIAPVVTPIMILGAAVSAVGLVSLSLAKVLFWPVWLLLWYFLAVVEELASWRGAAIGGIEVGWWWAAGCYAGLLGWVYGRRLMRKNSE